MLNLQSDTKETIKTEYQEGVGLRSIINIHKGISVSIPEGLCALNPRLSEIVQSEFNEYKSADPELRTTRNYTILRFLAELYFDISLLENGAKDLTTERVYNMLLHSQNSLTNPYAFSLYFYCKLIEKRHLLTYEEFIGELQNLQTLDRELGII